MAPATAHAAPAPPSRADLLAERLAADPIHVTDHAPREVPADAARARIRALVARLGVPAYVVVGPASLPVSQIDNRDLIPLLHDRLNKDGVYIVTNASGNGSARQYGGSLPAEQAWLTARIELPYKADVVAHVERFVEIMTAPDIAARITRRREAVEPPRRDLGGERDRKEQRAMVIGTAIGTLPVILLLAVLRLRKARR
ncbi:hypothetical protein [Actinomadura sp. 9N407]|uniref:hypothetical protein n=1 Tax=Actinomadura sp. 9N407 TaxID=3375154 RepID=UPI00379B21C5